MSSNPPREMVRDELAEVPIARYEVAYLSNRDRWSWRRKGHPFWIDRPSYDTREEAHNAAREELNING